MSKAELTPWELATWNLDTAVRLYCAQYSPQEIEDALAILQNLYIEVTL